MAFLRPLSETIAELAEGAIGQVPAPGGPLGPRVTSLELSLPIDIRLPASGNGLRGDVPLFRLRTAFDPEPAHLTIVLGEAPA